MVEIAIGEVLEGGWLHVLLCEHGRHGDGWWRRKDARVLHRLGTVVGGLAVQLTAAAVVAVVAVVGGPLLAQL